MKFCLYILYFPKQDKYYVGSTNNLERRINQHKSGYTYSTKRLRGVPELKFVQEFDSLKDARSAESRIKSWKRRDYIEKIINDGIMKSVSS